MLSKEFKTIELNNGQKQLTIVFHDERYTILSAFFFDEVGSFEDWIVQNIKDVLDAKADHREIAGNVFKLVIDKELSTVYDTLADDEKGDWCTVETSELLSLIGEWHVQKALLSAQQARSQ